MTAPDSSSSTSDGTDTSVDTPSKRRKLREAMGELTEYQAEWLDDESNLSRFLRADQGNFSKSEARLREYLAWRELTRPDTLVCKHCVEDEFSHYLHFIGYDKFNRPVLYSDIGAPTNRVVADNMEHIIQTLESAIQAMPEGVEKYVWVSDMAGFGFVDMNPWMGKASIELFGRYYPERMGNFILADCPRIFRGVWSALKPMIDDVTKDKIRFTGGPTSDSLKECFSELFPPELQEWLVTEMVENRKNKHKGKSFRKCCREGRDVPITSGSHDLRGTWSFLHSAECAGYHGKLGLAPPKTAAPAAPLFGGKGGGIKGGGGSCSKEAGAEGAGAEGAGEGAGAGAEGAGEGAGAGAAVAGLKEAPRQFAAGEGRVSEESALDSDVLRALSTLDMTRSALNEWASPVKN